MRPALRWFVGILTLIVGVGMFTLPDAGARGAMSQGTAAVADSPGPYLFGGFLILCSVACAMPVAPVCRVVAAGCTILCFLLAGFGVRRMIDRIPGVGKIELLELAFVSCAIGAGTAFYAFTGRLPSWLWIVLHQRPQKSDQTRQQP